MKRFPKSTHLRFESYFVPSMFVREVWDWQDMFSSEIPIPPRLGTAEQAEIRKIPIWEGMLDFKLTFPRVDGHG